MRIAFVVFLVAALAGCAPATPPHIVRTRAVPPPTFGQGYDEGYARGVADQRARAARALHRAAMSFDQAGCNVNTSALPKHERTLRQYAFARRTEQDMKIACARKYRAAVAAFHRARGQIEQ